MIRMLTLIASLVTCSATALNAADPVAPEKKAELAQKAYLVFKDSCHTCHGGTAQKSGNVVVLNHGNLVASRPSDDVPFITPGDLGKSLIWDHVDSGYMPQSGSPQAKAFTPEKKETLKQWILAGAPAWKSRDLKAVSDLVLLKAIREHLLAQRGDDATFIRYFSLAPLHNNPLIGEEELRLHRAALSKVVNSLSLQNEMILPQSVPGTEESLFAIDIRKVGWNRKRLWFKLTGLHPYGLDLDQHKDEALADVAKAVRRLTGHDDQFLIRADWFIVTATRPPLYHEFLDIPTNLRELERTLRVELFQNIRDTTEGNLLAARAGFSQSGVSKQNRLVERHELPGGGYYWISYDFKPRKAKADLVRFPLGPKFTGNPFEQLAFDHDGGEVIFSLPNHLQAYVLADHEGKRLDGPAPADIVFDRSAISGLPAIVNGISCFNCHKDGMIRFEDEVRTAGVLGGDALQKLRDLYPPRETMRKLVDQDRQRFLAALDKACGPFLKVGEDAGKTIDAFPEPVGRVAERYQTDLGPTEVACELGLDSADQLRLILPTNKELLKLGLGALAADPAGTMKRDKWETIGGSSLFQFVRAALGRGEVPVN
jgi:mono/diheme cytochrome c family protein